MKILILQLKRIGDLILTTPAIHCLREAFPAARLTLVTDASCRSLLNAIDVDEHWVFDRKSQWMGQIGFGPSAWMARDLPRYSGDFCLDFTGTDRAAFLSAFSSCKRRVAFERFQKKLLRSCIFTDFVPSSVRDRHTADHYTDLLQPLGISRDNAPLDLKLPAQSLITCKALLNDIQAGERFAVIHAGTARAEKYWAPDRWAKVAAFLNEEYHLNCILTGSRDHHEQAHLHAIKTALKTPCVDLSGRTDLLGLAAIIRQASIFCGVDTAAMHLADAMSTPTVALFGPTNPFHWKPRHTRSEILRADTCEPFKPGQKGGPMKNISTQAVQDAISRILKITAADPAD